MSTKASGWAAWKQKRSLQQRRADQKAYLKRLRKLKQSWVMSYLAAHPCVDCGESDPIVLEFDHMGSKNYDIKDLIVGWSGRRKLENEIALCVVRCANCHRRRHAKITKNYRSLK
jgi:hypothetical protein